MCVLEGVAAADDPPPGVGGDELRAIETYPSVLHTLDGLAIRGATPAESRILVDGFEIPYLYHFGVRTTVAGLEDSALRASSAGVEYGRATAAVLELETNRHRTAFDLSPFDLDLAAHYHGLTNSARFSLFPLWLPADTLGRAAHDATHFTQVPRYLDETLRFEHRVHDWVLAASGLFSHEAVALATERSNGDEIAHRRNVLRGTLTASYSRGPWQGLVAVSTMQYGRELDRGLVQHDRDVENTIDARAYVRREIGWVAGLRDFTIAFGGDLDVARHDLDIVMPVQARENAPQVGDPGLVDTSHVFRGIVWTPDGGAWTKIEGGLSKALTARIGLRVDAFGSHLAVQPRAELVDQLGEHTTIGVAAGAYRRPAEDREELEHPELGPERATQLALVLVHMRTAGEVLRGTFYYTDRTHLVERDGDGVLRNSGRGTDVGVELELAKRAGPWSGRVRAGLGHATRQDTPSSIERPAEYDQPVRLDAIAAWHHGGWTIAARFEARSGLPYTPVQAAIYDSDRDVYEPILARLYSERAPFHHQLDLRVDHVWRWSARYSLDAYLDIANVYDNRSAASYVYSYDYTQKTALESLPILPTIGVRGTL